MKDTESVLTPEGEDDRREDREGVLMAKDVDEINDVIERVLEEMGERLTLLVFDSMGDNVDDAVERDVEDPHTVALLETERVKDAENVRAITEGVSVPVETTLGDLVFVDTTLLVAHIDSVALIDRVNEGRADTEMIDTVALFEGDAEIDNAAETEGASDFRLENVGDTDTEIERFDVLVTERERAVVIVLRIEFDGEEENDLLNDTEEFKEGVINLVASVDDEAVAHARADTVTLVTLRVAGGDRVGTSEGGIVATGEVDCRNDADKNVDADGEIVGIELVDGEREGDFVIAVDGETREVEVIDGVNDDRVEGVVNKDSVGLLELDAIYDVIAVEDTLTTFDGVPTAEVDTEDSGDGDLASEIEITLDFESNGEELAEDWTEDEALGSAERVSVGKEDNDTVLVVEVYGLKVNVSAEDVVDVGSIVRDADIIDIADGVPAAIELEKVVD